VSSFSSNKRELTGFFADKMIEYSHNPIKDVHKVIKQTDKPFKGRFI